MAAEKFRAVVADDFGERFARERTVRDAALVGGAVNDLAVNSSDLDAGVAYYGRQAKAEDVVRIKAPLLLQYAGLDDRINAGIPAYREALEKAGKTFAINVYDGVNHAFNNDNSAARYDKAASDLAWSRTVEFFRKNLA